MCWGASAAQAGSASGGKGVSGRMSGRQRMTIPYFFPRKSSPAWMSCMQLAQRCVMTTLSKPLMKPGGHSRSEASGGRPDGW
jgi:hypothetical protein